MLAKFSLLAVLVPLARALTLYSPSTVVAGGKVTVTWTSMAGDPSLFDLYISNPPLLNQDMAILSSVQTSTGTATFEVPLLPATSNYSFRAADILNRTHTYASSGQFQVEPPGTPSSTVTADTTAPTASANSTRTATGTSTATSTSNKSSSGAASVSGHYAALLLGALSGAAAFAL